MPRDQTGMRPYTRHERRPHGVLDNWSVHPHAEDDYEVVHLEPYEVTDLLEEWRVIAPSHNE